VPTFHHAALLAFEVCNFLPCCVLQGFPFGRNVSECSSDTLAPAAGQLPGEVMDGADDDLHVDKCFTTVRHK
jgi:hypothetical protein